MSCRAQGAVTRQNSAGPAFCVCPEDDALRAKREKQDEKKESGGRAVAARYIYPQETPRRDSTEGAMRPMAKSAGRERVDAQVGTTLYHKNFGTFTW